MESLRETLHSFRTSGQVPHLLFHGPPGPTKLQVVLEFVDSLYDRRHRKTNLMVVNCAHGKGIKFIREELKLFAKSNSLSPNLNAFKTILLLNADQLTVDAQSALRRCIELFSAHTRFLLLVDNKNKLLKPILSRFCDLYVPEDPRRGYTFFGVQEKIDVPATLKERVALAHALYQRGVCSPELVQRMGLESEQQNALELYYYETKPHWRCEPMLLLSLLEFVHALAHEKEEGKEEGKEEEEEIESW